MFTIYFSEKLTVEFLLLFKIILYFMNDFKIVQKTLWCILSYHYSINVPL